MTTEQEKLIADILKLIVSACYENMGENWVKHLYALIDEIKSAGKP